MDKFNKCAAEIFGLLYERFPIRTDIEIQSFPEYDDLENREIFFSTVDFLDSEGFIKCNDKVYGGYMGVVLTAKGFMVLNSTPKAINEKSTLGDEIKNVLKSGKDEGIKSVIREIVRLFVA
ncbi:hypothetical protein [Thiobaca trueperi]|nr:hypothetical protein [Thiobaca trueperi]